MRRIFFYFVVSIAVILAGSVSADEHEAPGVSLGMGYHVKVKAGHGMDLAEGLKEFFAFRAEHGDPMDWAVFQVVGGKDVGDFVFYSGNNTWASMDAYSDWEAGAEAGTRWSNLAKEHVWDVENWLDRDMPEVSRWPEDEGYTHFWVATYHLKPGMGQKWNALVKKFHEAIVATDYPAHYSVSSGEFPRGNTRTFVWPYKSWADMAEPEVTVYDMLTSHYGEEEAQSMFEEWNSYYTESEHLVARIRLDLMPTDEE